MIQVGSGSQWVVRQSAHGQGGEQALPRAEPHLVIGQVNGQAAVGQQATGLHVVSQVDAEDMLIQGLPQVWIFHRKQLLHPAVQVARHEIRAAQQYLFVVAVAEVIDAGPRILSKNTSPVSG